MPELFLYGHFRVATSEIRHRCFGRGWMAVLALGVSMFGFAVPAGAQASSTTTYGEGEPTVKYVTGDGAIDLCSWEPMSCPRCMIEPWYCNGEPEFALSIAKAGAGTGTVKCKVGAGSAGACAAKYPTGTSLTLVAEAASGS